MDLTTGAAAAAGTWALASYLDARFHIRNDLKLGSYSLRAWMGKKFIESKMKDNKMLSYSLLEGHLGTPIEKKPYIIFEGREWTFGQIHQAIQPVANWLMKDLGIEKDEVVALDGPNSPEYIILWLALEAIGAIPAFINCNLTAQPLTHCVTLAKARYLLADESVRPLVEPIEEALQSSNSKAIYYSPEFISNLPANTTPIPKARQVVTDPQAPSNLIYTSGTTGLPKGTILTRTKEANLSMVGISIGLKPGDRMYTCLPLYHGAAHGLCMVPSLAVGSTVVLSRKFSHAKFWPEVHASGATHIQYVGELCRYLVNAPESKLDKGHKVHTAWGNGMRPDVWERFRERFGIENIHELYAATDGMLTTMNRNRGDFSRAAIGVRGPLYGLMNKGWERRILIDPDTQEVMRGDNGLAIEAKTGEAGESVFYMDETQPDVGTPTYFGNHSAAVKRRVRDVFRKGDMWFRTGDLMRLDSDGRLSFVDRLGDTFRWKSENVSTNEVSDVVGEFDQIAETNVYGVLVPNSDGRAGCAAVVPVSPEASPDSPIDFKKLAEHLLSKLPRYAVPIFVRVVGQLEYTGTMKMQKGRLRKEGIELGDIERVAKEKGETPDSVYWLPPGAKEYVPFRGKDLVDLKGNKVRL